MNETERRQRERFLFAVLLLFGICILLYVGQLAIGIAPNWEVAANMRSNLDPNSDFLTRKNSGIVEPLNPDILTLPAWLDILFTPNATLPTNAGITPPATRASTQAPTQPATLQPTIANTLPATAPTIYVPPSTKPGNKTSTPINIPIPSANLAITKTDGSTTYIPGGGISYQIVVTNGGPNNASGFRVTDAVPAVINITSVNCAPSGTASCGTNVSSGNNVSFTDISVNAGAGNLITINVNGTVNVGATGNLINTANIVIPGGASFSDPNTSNNTATDTDTAVVVTDLSITKDDSTPTYTAGGVVTYIVTVMNVSTTNVNGAFINDNRPSQVATWDWDCTAQNGGAGGCDPVINSNTNFTDIVNLPAGSSIVYTVTANISGTASGNLVNTAAVSLPAGYTDLVPGNNSWIDTDTPIYAVDLSITKNDSVTTYTPGGTLTYTIVVTNNSTSVTVSGALVTNSFPAQISSANWTCTGDCTANSSGNINDTVNLPANSSITYTVTANVSASAAGTLTNTASVTVPAGFIDTDLSNNSATDNPADTSSAPSEPNIGPPDTSWIGLPTGMSKTIVFSPAIIANGDVGTPDLVYYEVALPPATTTVFLDWVQIEISSDGSPGSWVQVFYWGDPGGLPDTNTNVDINPLDPINISDLCATEIDNCAIPIGRLYNNNSTGITIDIDAIPGIVTGNSYPWIRIMGLGADGPDIDAIQPLLP